MLAGFAYLCLQSVSVPLPQLALSGVFLFSEIGKLLDFSFVESVDNGVFSLFDMYPLNLQFLLIP